MNAVTTEFAVKTIAVRNPATDEVIGEIPCLGVQEIAPAVKRASRAQKRWAASPVSVRLKILRRFQQLLCEQKDSVAAIITREAGKPLAEAVATEVLVVLETVNFLVANVPEFLQTEDVPHGSPVMKLKRGRLLREPCGVIRLISSGNFPLTSSPVQTLTALATGNAVLRKPSEFTPFSSLEMQKLLVTAGLEQDLLQVVTGDGAAGAALLS